VFSNQANLFQNLTVTELKAASGYFKAVSAARRNNLPLPARPTGNTAVAAQFFRTVTSACKGAEHTSEHAADARVRSYNMHYRFGKPTWWYVYSNKCTFKYSFVSVCEYMSRITISPDDVCNVKIWSLATGDSPSAAPASQLRFEKLANNPGAAALQFKRLVDVVYKYILGWDPVARRPLRTTFEGQTWEGGLLGITEAFEFAVEEQGRLSLHLHMLVWTAGHSDFIDRLELQQLSMSNLSVIPSKDPTTIIEQKSCAAEKKVLQNGDNIRTRARGRTTSTTGNDARYEVE
jgi:hypothetical protein